MATPQGIEWEDVIKKEARGTNDDDLGEVQDIGQTYVVTQKGMLSKDPRIENWEVHVLAFATCVEVGVKALGITKIAVSATIAPNENINLLIFFKGKTSIKGLVIYS